MKKNAIIFFTAILASTLILSCASSVNELYIEKVNLLEKKIDSLSLALAQIDTAKVASYYSSSVNSLKFIQETHPDTMSKEIAFFLSDFKANKKSLERLVETCREQSDELVFSKSQLEKLKTDIKNSLLYEEQFTQYLETEKAAIEKSTQTIANLNQWYQTSVKKYEEWNPKVQQLVEKLKNLNTK
jgi:DNA repair exonuclease SbcCD ATPase subunit